MGLERPTSWGGGQGWALMAGWVEQRDQHTEAPSAADVELAAAHQQRPVDVSLRHEQLLRAPAAVHVGQDGVA